MKRLIPSSLTQKPRTSVAAGALLMLLSAFMTVAMAQTTIPEPPGVNQLMQATPPGDWSIKIFTWAFGEFATNPLTDLGGPTTLLGSIFLIFNTCVFILGGAWASWGILTAISNGAHEGEALGNRMNTHWFPIRLGMGTVGLLPVLSGFSIQQGVMMFMTLVGIGIGNSVMIGAVNHANMFQPLVAGANFSPSVQDNMRRMVYTMFVNNVCLITQAADDQNTGNMRSPNSRVQSLAMVALQNGRVQLNYGSPDDPTTCGSVTLTASRPARNESQGLTGFSVNSVDYEAIAARSNTAYQSALQTAQNSVGQIAANWLNLRQQAHLNGSTVPPFPKEDLDRVYVSIAQNVRSSIATFTQSEGPQSGAFKDKAKENMKVNGWLGLGAWYMTFAEYNSALADAAQGPQITTTQPGVGTGGGGIGWSSLAMSTQSATSAAMSQLSAISVSDKSKGADEQALNSVIQDYCDSRIGGEMMATATGNCSMGQAMLSQVFYGLTGNSGGGGGLREGGFVNPVIIMKNLGDYMMTFSASILGTETVMRMASMLPMKGAISSAVGTLQSKFGGGEAAANTSGILHTLAIVMLVAGGFLSVYLPMVPFITWIGATVAYITSVFEGIAGAQLHAFSHLDARASEGLGSRTERGYIFLINVIFRPALMVIGFFVASFIIVAVGTLQAYLFLPAVANVQGNTVTGLMSILGFIAVFIVMNVTLIQMSFNIIYVFTDQVIGMIGNQINSSLGRETEDKIYNMFMMTARASSSGVGQMSAIGKDAAKDGSGGAGGGSPTKNSLSGMGNNNTKR